MFRRTFKVIYRPMKNNFVLLPENYYNLVSTYDNGCLTMTFGKTCHCVSWLPYAGQIRETEIGINSKVAKEIGLKENEVVKVALVGDTLNLSSVYVTPATQKDWEIIELSTEKLESTILEQIRIINTAETFVVWVNRSMHILLQVDRVKPKTSFGRIDNTTELIVSPNIQQNGRINSSLSNNITDISHNKPPISRSKTISNIVANQTPNLTRSSTNSDMANNNYNSIMQSSSSSSLSSHHDNRRSLVLSNEISSKIDCLKKYERIIKDLKKENLRKFEFRVITGNWENSHQISDIFTTKNNLPEFMDLDQVYVLQKKDTNDENEYYVNVKVVTESDLFPNNIHHTIEINENLMKLLNIKELDKVTLQSKSTILNFVERIDLFANSKTSYKLVERAFKKYVIENTKLSHLLINQDQILKLEDNIIVTVHITPDHFKYCLLDAQILREGKIYASDDVKNVDDLLNVEQQEENIISVKDLIKIKKFDDIVDMIEEQIKLNLCLDTTNNITQQGNILIAGPRNSGKTVLVETILDKLSQKPYCCFYNIFFCTRSKGRKVESIQKDLRQVFTTSLKHLPSIIVLENLDALACRTENEQQSQDSEYFNRIADTIHNLIVSYTNSNPIVIIGTVTRVENLNSRLYAPRGRHIFHNIIQIPELERDDRELILGELSSHLESCDLDLKKFSILTKGYNFGDLVQFVERAIFYAYRINPNSPILTDDLLLKSLENTNSYCLQGVKSNYKKDHDESHHLRVEEIPGLENVVNVLEEVIRWPAEYPDIFENSPLRNQAGILLFGPPGTGKTFLVSQISNSWNLRTISVKGPELLAKYIGQSEENVRKLFQKARSAKPCILFFDEFDSLAPKRGHDSTGVTDRVVNQLLTELDGVEDLQGVTVIAATSRPELLDPALLRSGRLDRIVECKIPDRLARKQIFIVHSKLLCLDESVDFDQLSEKTENFTGADIQSILTTANMTAVKEALKLCNNETFPAKVVINQQHLINALNETRPSLSPVDILRCQRIYARFTNKEKQHKDGLSKKATLA